MATYAVAPMLCVNLRIIKPYVCALRVLKAIRSYPVLPDIVNTMKIVPITKLAIG